jgi:hypothetical protein
MLCPFQCAGTEPLPVRAPMTAGDLLQPTPRRSGRPNRAGTRPAGERVSTVSLHDRRSERSLIMTNPGNTRTPPRRPIRQHGPHVQRGAVHQKLPANAGPPWPPSTCATTAHSPKSAARSQTAPPCGYAGCVTAATPTGGASPYTWPAKSATKTPTYLTVGPSAPPKKPSTAPAAFTSTTPPPGDRSNPDKLRPGTT